MRAPCNCVLLSTLAVLALGCAKEPRAEPEVEYVEVPAEPPTPIPAQFLAPPEVDSDTGQAEVTRTPEELRALIEPSETPPPMPTDHRLRLGIDGDPGYEQEELTPEELAAARAAGAAVPQPSYAPQPSEPSRAEQPSEASGSASEEESETVYVGGTRAPVYRHQVREEARENGRGEPSAQPQPQEPQHASPPRRAPHR